MNPFSVNHFAYLAETLSTTLLHFVWQGSLLALLLFLAVTPIFSSPVDKDPTPAESDQTGYSINLSDLNGIKIQSWELKQQIGE